MRRAALRIVADDAELDDFDLKPLLPAVDLEQGRRPPPGDEANYFNNESHSS
jgi:hypothetical protein